MLFPLISVVRWQKKEDEVRYETGAKAEDNVSLCKQPIILCLQNI